MNTLNAILRHDATVGRGLGLLVGLEAATFFIGALAHTGREIPLGFAVLAEPRIVPAMIVESLCGLALAASAYAILRGRAQAWAMTAMAHLIAISGVLLGMAALAAGRGPRSELNDLYHRVILVVLIAVLGLVLTPLGQAILGRERADADE